MDRHVYRGLPPWLRIYMLFLASFVPAVVNLVPNALIFVYVRSSTNRIQRQASNSLTGPGSSQHSKISRREITLVKQMTYMFVILIVGGSPIFFVTALSSYFAVGLLIYHTSYILCELSILNMILTLFRINHDLRQYLWNKIRCC